MSEQTTQETQQAQVTQQTNLEEPSNVEQPKGTPQKDEGDLISRVSRFVEENAPEKVVKDDGEGFDLKEIESIQDPVAKEQALKAYKSFQRGFNQKFMELSELKKEIQGLKQTPERQAWTAQRVQELVNDPEFIRAAQEVAGTTQSEDDEYIPDSVKQKLQKLDALEKEILTIKNVNTQAMRSQQDQNLKSRYANYDPNAVDVITKDLLAGKVQATREHLWKVVDYDSAIERAYKMGLQDRKEGLADKLSSSESFSPNNAVPAEQVAYEPKDSDKDAWGKIMQKVMTKVKNKN